MKYTFLTKVAFLFRELPDFSEDDDTECNLFQSAITTSAAVSCGCKRVGGQMGNKKLYA